MYRTGVIYCSAIETQLNDTAERDFTTRRISTYLHTAYATVCAIAIARLYTLLYYSCVYVDGSDSVAVWVRSLCRCECLDAFFCRRVLVHIGSHPNSMNVSGGVGIHTLHAVCTTSYVRCRDLNTHAQTQRVCVAGARQRNRAHLTHSHAAGRIEPKKRNKTNKRKTIHAKEIMYYYKTRSTIFFYLFFSTVKTMLYRALGCRDGAHINLTAISICVK